MKNNTLRTKNSYYFSEIDNNRFQKILDIKFVNKENIFNELFEYKYTISDYENKFLNDWLDIHKFYLKYYTTFQLQSQFINLLLSIVNFNTDNLKSWHEYEISSTINNYELKGEIDFILASGVDKPINPYFIITKFNHLNKNNTALSQLLAGMLVVMTKYSTNFLYGVYNVGKMWNFVILEKNVSGEYQYCISSGLNSIKINNLKQIYITLQAIKQITKI